MLEPDLESRSALYGTVRRFGWGLSDQALSSLTNFALGLLVARSVDTTRLGDFALAFNTYLVALTLSRVFSTAPLTIRYSACSEKEWRRASRAATATAALFGIVSGAMSALAGLAIGGSPGATFIALGATLPGLLVQDAWRFVFFARSSGNRAFLNDLIWGLALVVLFVLAHESGRDSVAYLTAAWGAAAGVAAVAGAFQARIVPAPGLVRRWFAGNHALSMPLIGDAGIRLASGNLSVYLIAVVAGLGALGSLRAAVILLGPTTMIILGLGLVAVPEGARRLAESPEKLRRNSVAVSAVAGMIALAWGVLVFLLPPSVGRVLVGVSWDSAHPLLIPLTISSASMAAAVGATSGLKALQAGGRIFRTSIVEGVIAISIAVIGASWGGATGVARAAAVGSTLITVIWWHQFTKTLQERRLNQRRVQGTAE